MKRKKPTVGGSVKDSIAMTVTGGFGGTGGMAPGALVISKEKSKDISGKKHSKRIGSKVF